MLTLRLSWKIKIVSLVLSFCMGYDTRKCLNIRTVEWWVNEFCCVALSYRMNNACESWTLWLQNLVYLVLFHLKWQFNCKGKIVMFRFQRSALYIFRCKVIVFESAFCLELQYCNSKVMRVLWNGVSGVFY